MRQSNIVLIGMPGAGKSTIGVLLAKALKMPFTDTDLVIQQREDKFLHEIIAEKGIKGFLDIEEEAILGLSVKGHVIATGGSVVYRSRAMEHLSSDGLIVYIKASFEEIEKRIKNISTRGIAMEKGQTLYALYCERIPLYEKYADITVATDGMDIEKAVERIRSEILRRKRSGA